MNRFLRAASGAAATWLVACTRPPADPAAAGAAEPAGGSVTLWTDSTELFMEHPALIVNQPDKFAVHLTDLTNFQPLRSGRITMRFVPRDGGAPLEVVQETPRAPGIYGPAPTFTRAGLYDLSILVDSPQARDSLFVPELRVYATVADAPVEEGGGGEGISYLKEQQWKVPEFRTAFPRTGEVLGGMEVSGTIEPAAGRLARVSAPVAGLFDASALASSPVPGARVARGAVLALLAPSLGEGGGAAMAEARARLREAEDEHERAKRLFAVEAVPQRRVHEAEIRLAAAREALSGYAGGELIDGNRIAVRAPLGGIVVTRMVTPGSRVEAGAPLFDIVDASTVWLRADLPAALVSAVSRSAVAAFQVEGATTTVRSGRLVSIGTIVDSLSRTVPVRFEVPNASGRLPIGATARVTVRSGTRERGLLIPLAAVLEEDGRPVVYVQPEGERFERREVVLGPSEGGRVLVRSGIAATDRVVTGAAYQVRLASLSTAVPMQGHEH